MKAHICAAIAALILLGTTPAVAQTAQDVCAQTACRDGGFSVLVVFDKDADGGFLAREVVLPRSPYVLEDGAILLFPGETIVYSLKAEGNFVKATFLKRYYPDYPHVQPSEINESWRNPADNDLPVLEKNEDGHPVLGPDQLMISYGQPQAEQGKPDVFLVMWHNFSGSIQPALIMSRFGESEMRMANTSACTLKSGLTSYEHWPHAIGGIIITGLTLKPSSDEIVCK